MTRPITHVAAGVLVRDDGEFLLGSRPEGKPYAGYWEFPGGKLEPGESALAALKRELNEEMGIEVVTAYPWLTQEFIYPHATVRLHFFQVTRWKGEIQPQEGQQFVWQRPGMLTVAPMLPANTPILRGLELPNEMAISNVAELGESEYMRRLARRLTGGLRWLMLREPHLERDDFALLAEKVLALAKPFGVRVIINRDPELARQLGAAGVHLRSPQLMALQERPEGLDWVGASTHSGPELAHAARLGLDYAFLGTLQPTPSHPDGDTLGWGGFARIVSHGYTLPVYAIGGLSLGDLPAARQHGGHGVALLRAAWNA